MFPISAKDLVESAQNLIEQESNTVKQQLLDIYLPRTVEVILTRQPDCRKLIKERIKDSETQAQLVAAVSQALWSHPGSMGGVKIERIFYEVGFNLDDSDEIATRIVKYSRYTMAVVNHLRHYRSAITGVRDLIISENRRERYFSNTNMQSWLQSDWLEQAEKVSNKMLKNVDDLTAWLADVETLLATMQMQNSSRRSSLSSDTSLDSSTKPSLGGGNAQAYTRRFGQYINLNFQITGLGGRYATRDKTLLDELADVKYGLAGDDHKVFKMLEEHYLSRQSRISVSTKPPASRSLSKQSLYEEHATNLLSAYYQFGSREFIIRYSAEKISSTLFDQMLKVFRTQLKIEPDLKRFLGKVIIGEQALEVELDRPTKKDEGRIRQYLEAHFS